MKRAKAEKIKKGIDDKIRKSTVDMEWWANFWGFTVDEYEEFLDMAVKALEQEPKRGYWLDAREEDPCWFICSECKTMVDADYNYCPHCGAKMENDDE